MLLLIVYFGIVLWTLVYYIVLIQKRFNILLANLLKKKKLSSLFSIYSIQFYLFLAWNYISLVFFSSYRKRETQKLQRSNTLVCVSTSTSAYKYQLLCLHTLRFGSLFPPILSPEFRIKRKLWMKTRHTEKFGPFLDRRWVLDVIVESILQMKQLQSLNQSQRIALAGVLSLLFPIFSPNLFRPLGRASPSLFSVSLISLSLFISDDSISIFQHVFDFIQTLNCIW